MDLSESEDSRRRSKFISFLAKGLRALPLKEIGGDRFETVSSRPTVRLGQQLSWGHVWKPNFNVQRLIANVQTKGGKPVSGVERT